MKRQTSISRILLAALPVTFAMALACNVPPSEDSVRPGQPESQGCDCPPATCLGPDHARACNSACQQETYDCTQVCLGGGYDYSAGCYPDANTGAVACRCGICECAGDERRCGSDATLEVCDGCNWQAVNCASECVQEGGYDFSQGCDYVSEEGEYFCICGSN